MGTKAEEEAVFDRQMRLWGADAQARIRAARVVIRGRFTGLSSELAKNLVLAGINVSLLDEDHVQAEDVLTNIFLRAEDIGKPRAAAAVERLQEMNPFAQVNVLTQGNDENLSEYALVVSVSEAFATVHDLSHKCRAAKVPLMFMHSAGMLAICIIDVGESYTFGIEGKQGESKTLSFPSIHDVLTFSDWTKLPTGRKAYPEGILSLFCLRELEVTVAKENGSPKKKARNLSVDEISREMAASLPAKSIKDVTEFTRAANILVNGKSFAPVNTISGGVFGQEVLKVVTKQGEPVRNVILFDGKDASATVRSIPPQLA